MPKSNIITLNEGAYEYALPTMPPEKDILYYNIPKSQQFWKTPADTKRQLDIPDVRKMTERQRIETIELWRDRWLNGMWFFNQGLPYYLSGLHFEHLCINTYNSQKLLYFDDERYLFYFIDLTEKASECEGRTWIKPRRAKMTTIMCSLAQRKLLMDFSNYITIQSDTLDKCQKSYMNPIIDSYVRRPTWMREEYYAPNGKKPRKALELTSNIITKEGDEWMGGKINIFPTVAKATDGLEAIESILDEFSKVEDTSPYEMFEVNRKVIQNFRKQGKIDCLSSTGDSKDAAKATLDWHKLIAGSNPHNKDQFGKTVTGLWEYFISAIHSQYVPKEFTDKHGFVNKDQAEQWIWNEIRKYPEGTKERIFAMYKLPLKKEHALLSSSIANIFSRVRIASRLDYLDGLLPDQKPYIRVKLVDKAGKVYKEPDPAGLWLWAVEPYFSAEKNIDTRNRFRLIEGVHFPPVNPEGAIGYDPVNYPKGSLKSTNYSQACIVVHKKFDYFNHPNSPDYIADEKMALYLGRPDDPHEVNKEAIKACKLTGYPLMHERSVAHVEEDFRTAGMLPFLLKGEDGLYGIAPQNQRAIRDGIAMLQSRYSPPKEDDQKDHIAIHPFEDCLRSHRDFDPSNTQAFDPTMGELYLEHGLKQIIYTNKTDSQVSGMLTAAQAIAGLR